MKQGTIIKVSGPLVVAKGCAGSKMYDMVRVSEKKLIGEIIELKGDLAFIQVYEETAGIGPGEPVYLTNEPLSVELGPGLISSIYDGIQRPLDIIRMQSGDFIARGIDVPSLNQEKIWHFSPVIKSGQKVTEGDILGIVDETVLIKHKIMVPPGVNGIIAEIKKGDFKVKDVIAKIKTDNGTVDVTLSLRWPVRRPRPVKEKFSPCEPLTTGQRVIDTLFPIAKGGTACIPGPFGSGKCVSPDTPVMLGDGDIRKIKDIFNESLQKGEVVVKDNETIIYLKEPLAIFTLSQNGIVRSHTHILYKGKSDSLLRIKTRSGRLVEVTPAHKLFKIDPLGHIIQEEAKDLRVGDYISSIKYLECDNEEAHIGPYLLKKARVADKKIKQQVADMLKLLIKERRLGLLNLTTRDIRQFAYDMNLPTVELTEKIYKLFGLELPPLKFLCGTTSRGFVKIPQKVTSELAEFLGFFIAKGNIRKNQTIVFTNSNEKLLKRFIDLGAQLFDVKGQIVRQKMRCPAVIINRKVLVDFLKEVIATGNASSKQVPPLILRSGNSALAGFLRGYYLGDGSFSDDEIELTTASKDLQIGLSYLLSRLGIFHVLSKKRYKNKDYYRIFIRGIKYLRLFYESVKDTISFDKIERIKNYINSKNGTFSAYDIVPLSNDFIQDVYKTSGVIYTKFKNKGIEISNYTTNEENMSTDLFEKFVLTTKHAGYPHLSKLNRLLENIFCDRIVSVEEIEGPSDVYDFSIPETENFVGGWGGVLLHNTVVFHEFAKWSDAQVVVYVACGERGNECADLLLSFPELKDPRSGRPLMERTVIVANTSNMPVAAREASIYTGIAIAEYFRDMGYSVALMADSTSRWAEALREISGRLEEMPGEEGYPAYLSSRVAEFYERAGRVHCLGSDSRLGTLSVMGAVSPPGGDLSDPVVQATLRVVKVFWGLDDKLANARHFPAINWLLSYSLYHENLEDYLRQNIAANFIELRKEAMRLLEEESELLEIARLVGIESLTFSDRLILEVAKSIREDFLHQNAFHEIDTYTSLTKQHRIIKIILEFYHLGKEKLKEGVDFEKIVKLPVRERISRLKYIEEDKLEEFDKVEEELKNNYA